ncbi:uncharacterized protein LOC113789906 [Dermatophagoides pteronyssinus]|uniref:uncharacterized protein LOC113789906 n=1 Tax=Dermatophagoides pteronyssinus TaxID=6956 RepID=UPI003F666D3E
MEKQQLKEKTLFLRKKFSSIVYKINNNRVTGLILNEYIDFINELRRHVDESKWIELTLMEERWNLVSEFIKRNMETPGIDRQKLLESLNKSKILASKISFIQAPKPLRQDHSLVIAYNKLRNNVTSEEICPIHKKKFRTYQNMFNHLRSDHPDVYVGSEAEPSPALESKISPKDILGTC